MHLEVILTHTMALSICLLLGLEHDSEQSFTGCLLYHLMTEEVVVFSKKISQDSSCLEMATDYEFYQNTPS